MSLSRDIWRLTNQSDANSLNVIQTPMTLIGLEL